MLMQTLATLQQESLEQQESNNDKIAELEILIEDVTADVQSHAFVVLNSFREPLGAKCLKRI